MMSELICMKSDRCKLGDDCPHKLRSPAVCYEYENKRLNYDDLCKKSEKKEREQNA